jgi:chaperonin cofactor prefoldin
MLIKVEGTPFSKDTKTGALLTTAPSVLRENEARKKLSKSITDKNNEINTLRTKVEAISSDVNEIKSLLNQLLEKK